MVGSIDPRCETVRGTHWPKEGRVVVWSSRRGNHLGQRSIAIASTGRTYGCKRSDQTVQKTLVARGPSTYGSLLSQGRRWAPGCSKKTKMPERKKSAPALHPSESLRGVVAGDRLDLEIFFQAVFAPLAAVAGLLVAAERRGAVVRHALQIDVAGADPAPDPAGGFNGVCGDVAGETIRRVVGDPHRIFLILG